MLDLQRLLNETFIEDVAHFEMLPSTQDYARLAAADAAAKLPLLVVSETQSAGRGRGANHWWTGSGSLAFSLVLDPVQFGLPAIGTPQCSLAVAVALIDAVGSMARETLLGLHWPNDIFVGDRKLAGILVDVLAGGRHVIGVGVNSNNSSAAAPLELRERVATLRDLTGREHDHTELLIAILHELNESLLELSQKPEALGRRFDELCLQHGQILTVRSGHEIIQGVCEGIAPDGALLLATAEGRQKCYSGTLR